MTLTAKGRQSLKARAHKLKPVVLLGNKGFTPAVKNEMNIALNDHDLIKIRIPNEDRDERTAILTEVCESLQVELVQRIGKIAVLYRKKKS